MNERTLYLSGGEMVTATNCSPDNPDYWETADALHVLGSTIFETEAEAIADAIDGRRKTA